MQVISRPGQTERFISHVRWAVPSRRTQQREWSLQAPGPAQVAQPDVSAIARPWLGHIAFRYYMVKNHGSQNAEIQTLRNMSLFWMTTTYYRLNHGGSAGWCHVYWWAILLVINESKVGSMGHNFKESSQNKSYIKPQWMSWLAQWMLTQSLASQLVLQTLDSHTLGFIRRYRTLIIQWPFIEASMQTHKCPHHHCNICQGIL